MPNYYDMSGEPAAASAQPTTGADNGPTAEETIGATTTGTTQEQQDVQRLHKYKLPPPFFTGDYSQYEEWLFNLQAYLGLIDRDFDMVLQLAQAAARQIEDADIRAHIRDLNYSATTTNHNNYRITTTKQSTPACTRVPRTTASHYSLPQIFPCNTNYYYTNSSLHFNNHSHLQRSTTLVFEEALTSLLPSLPTTTPALTTALVSNKATESSIGLSTPNYR